MTSVKIIKSGYLHKQSRHLYSWRNRWTVLSNETNNGGTFYYLCTYKLDTTDGSPTEKIEIADDTQICEVPIDDTKFYIENTKFKEKFIFNASSTNEKQEWIKSIFLRKQQYFDNVLVIGFIHQINTIESKLRIPLKVQEIVCLFCGSWVPYTIDNKVDARRLSGKWNQGIIKYNISPLDSIYQYKLTQKLTSEQVLNLHRLHKLRALFICFYFDDVNEHWTKFKVGDKIDVNDSGTWYNATIIQHKNINEPISIDAKLNKTQQTHKVQKLEGLYVRYLKKKFRKFEWIFIEKHTICTCTAKCTSSYPKKHIICAPNTQSEIQSDKKCLVLSRQDALKYIWGTWIFLENDSVCNCYCGGRLCDNLNHKLTKTSNHKKTNYNEILVMNFIQKVEIKYNVFIPLDIKEIIYLFWGRWINCSVWSKIDARNAEGIWFGAIINYHKLALQPIPSKYLKAFLEKEQSKHIDTIETLWRLEAVFVTFHFDDPNNNWTNFKVGDKIDCRDKQKGHWYVSTIKQHKKDTEASSLAIMESVLVHYDGWDDKWDEWIFIEKNTICTCHSECKETDVKTHRISPPYTQSQIVIYKRENNIESENVWGEWIFIQNDAICNAYCGRWCNNPKHRLSRSRCY